MTRDLGAVIDGRATVLHVEIPPTGTVTFDADGWSCTCGVWYRKLSDRPAVADTACAHGFSTGHSIDVGSYR